MAKMVLGIFSMDDDAAEAIRELNRDGYDPKDISIMMRDNQGVVTESGSRVGEGLVSGATTGGIIGALAGLAIGVGAIVIPGVGGFLVGGPLAVALGITGAAATTVTGAVTGVVAGGIVGALIGLGIPEEEARSYEESINRGGILVAVPAREGEEQEAADVLDEYHADQIKIITTTEPRIEATEEEYERPAYYSEVKKGRRRRTP